MHRSIRLSASLSAAAALATLAACETDGTLNLGVTPITNTTFVQRNLVADLTVYGAVTVDLNLVNPWKMPSPPRTAVDWASSMRAFDAGVAIAVHSSSGRQVG